MDRKNSTYEPVVIFVICMVVISGVAMEVTLVSAEMDKDRSLNISDSGDAGDLFSFENTHGISNIEISVDNKSSSEYMTLYINFVELQNSGINVSDVGVKESTVSNAEIIEVNRQRSDEERILAIQIKRQNTSNPVQIKSVKFDKINGSKGEKSNNIQYRVGVINNNSTDSYNELKTNGDIRKSTEFDFIDGSIKVKDQATVSTNFIRSSRTSSGVTISGLRSNNNATVVLTDEDNGEIVGYKSQTVQEMSMNDSISLNTSNLGGKYRVYLIPTGKISIDEDDIGTVLSDRSRSFAVDKDRLHVYLGTVEFKNEEYTGRGATNISIASSEVRDTVGMNTPYIISIHPVTADNKVAYDEYIGYSDVLAGVNDELAVPIRDARGNENRVWHSNRFVATIRLAQGQKPGEPVDLNTTEPLPNSDIKHQFVDGGVSDSANIHINNIPTEQNSSRLDRRFNHTGYDGEQLYSGEVVVFENNTSTTRSVKLQRNIADDKSVIAGVGSHLNDTNGVVFNTTGLKTGVYSLSGGGFASENQFKLFGRTDQEVELKNTIEKTKIGSRAHYGLYHNTSEVSLKISDLDTNRTVATANLSTPAPGRTSIGVNTYALGNESLTDRFVTAGPGATVESVDTSISNGTLPPGTYRIAVRSEQGLASTADEATVTIGDRSTNGVTAYATTALDRSDLGTADAVRRAIANGTLSPTSTVASNETVVYAANATGLTGLPAARNATPETGADLSRLDGLAFGVRSNASATEDDGTDADGPVPPNSSVHVDSTGLYLVAEGADALATDETPADGETFTAEFRVEDERLREAASDATDDHAVSTTVAFEALPTSEGDEDTASDDPIGGGSGGDGGGGSSGGGGSDGSGSTGGGGSGGDGGGGSSGGGGSDGSGSTGGGGSGGAGGGGGGGASGGGTGAGGGATAGGNGPAEATPGAGAAPSGSKAAKPNGKNGDRSVIGPGRNKDRFGIRPVADVRPVAGGDSIASPASVSPAVASANAGASPTEGDAASSEPGADRGDAGSDRAGGDNSGAEATEAAGANGADAESDVRDGPAAKSESPDGEPETPSYDDAPIRTTADDVPGFGPLVTLVALLLTGRLAARRRSRGP